VVLGGLLLGAGAVSAQQAGPFIVSDIRVQGLQRVSAGNVFNETESHGVRQLVTAPELLAPIE